VARWNISAICHFEGDRSKQKTGPTSLVKILFKQISFFFVDFQPKVNYCCKSRLSSRSVPVIYSQMEVFHGGFLLKEVPRDVTVMAAVKLLVLWVNFYTSAYSVWNTHRYVYLSDLRLNASTFMTSSFAPVSFKMTLYDGWIWVEINTTSWSSIFGC